MRLLTLFPLDIDPGVELLDHSAGLFLIVGRTSILFSTIVLLTQILRAPHRGSLVYPSSSALTFCLFHNSHSNTVSGDIHCYVNLHFPDDW